MFGEEGAGHAAAEAAHPQMIARTCKKCLRQSFAAGKPRIRPRGYQGLALSWGAPVFGIYRRFSIAQKLWLLGGINVVTLVTLMFIVIPLAKEQAVQREVSKARAIAESAATAAAPFKAGGRGGPEYYTDVPAGVVAINRAQERGYSMLTAG